MGQKIVQTGTQSPKNNISVWRMSAETSIILMNKTAVIYLAFAELIFNDRPRSEQAKKEPASKKSRPSASRCMHNSEIWGTCVCERSNTRTSIKRGSCESSERYIIMSRIGIALCEHDAAFILTWLSEDSGKDFPIMQFQRHAMTTSE